MAGTRLLVVDPLAPGGLRDDLSPRGIHVTVVDSTLDGLVQFGSLQPAAVVVAADSAGASAADFIMTARRHRRSAFVAASGDGPAAADVGPLLLAGAGAVLARPYSAGDVCGVLDRLDVALTGAPRLRFGPLEVDAAAYTVRVEGSRLPDLPLREFELLHVLMAYAPEVVEDSVLRRAIWGDATSGPRDNAIAVRMTHLRSLLGDSVEIRRIRGRGYSLSTG